MTPSDALMALTSSRTVGGHAWQVSTLSAQAACIPCYISCQCCCTNLFPIEVNGRIVLLLLFLPLCCYPVSHGDVATRRLAIRLFSACKQQVLLNFQQYGLVHMRPEVQNQFDFAMWSTQGLNASIWYITPLQLVALMYISVQPPTFAPT